MNLNDAEDYMSGDELMDENSDGDEAVAVEDTLMSTAETRAKRGKRRTSRCWKHFSIVGEKYPDGSNDVVCKFCKHNYYLNLRRSGTSSLLRHMKVCTLNPVPGTPGSGRKIDQLVFREMIAIALIEHNLPYSFVEYC